jgi:isoamylase
MVAMWCVTSTNALDTCPHSRAGFRSGAKGCLFPLRLYSSTSLRRTYPWTLSSERRGSVSAVKDGKAPAKTPTKVTKKSKGKKVEILPGCPEPMGATYAKSVDVVNFALFAGNASGVSLCLFTEDDLKKNTPTMEVELDRECHRTGDVWHVGMQGLFSGKLEYFYGYRVKGIDVDSTLNVDMHGMMYDSDEIVLDPYAESIYNGRRSFGELYGGTNDGDDRAKTWPQAVALVPSPQDEFDWEGDAPLEIPIEDLVIYEAHVRGFTADKSSGVKKPGTYPGLVERLDYLEYLGINAIELLPVFEFNELEYYQVSNTEFNRYNYWGYSTVGFFAPMARYSHNMADESVSAVQASRAVIHEFKTFVKEAHKRGIEVILDVVFNHTAEGNEHGPTISFRGIDNRVYYMLAPKGEYYNYSGCGNTFNCNHPVARRFIVDCLRYWVEEMHVDGFRFDLASIMTRAHSLWHPFEEEDLFDEDIVETPTSKKYFPSPDMSGEWSEMSEAEELGHELRGGIMPEGAGEPTGTPLSDPPLIAAISTDPILSKTKLIAEAWDCDGLNQVGAFPHYGGRWSEWNGHFRDATRQFIKGTDGSWVGSFAASLCGSPNIYINEPGEHDWWGNHGGRRWKSGRGPTASVNFVTAHDGFSLADLVSYNDKHNEANGEDNRDGESHNLSWNCGEEGPTAKLSVNQLRSRQMRNFMTALLVSNGVPMILMGDEYGHTKNGNNNTYCHDSELNYLDWDAARSDNDGMLRFTKAMISLRKRFSGFRRSWYPNDGDVDWHGVTPGSPDWSEESRFLAMTVKGQDQHNDVYVAWNTSHKPIMVHLPETEGKKWRPLVDSGKASPFDILIADDRLSRDDVDMALASCDMMMRQNVYTMLPWSSIILESIDDTIQEKMPAPYNSKHGDF